MRTNYVLSTILLYSVATQAMNRPPSPSAGNNPPAFVDLEANRNEQPRRFEITLKTNEGHIRRQTQSFEVTHNINIFRPNSCASFLCTVYGISGLIGGSILLWQQVFQV